MELLAGHHQRHSAGAFLERAGRNKKEHEGWACSLSEES